MKGAPQKKISQAIPPQMIPSQAFPRTSSLTEKRRATTPEGWQVVQRKQRFPSQTKDGMMKPYVPYFRRSTYAQMVVPASNPTSPRLTDPKPPTRPTTPTTPKETYYYISPHSPTNLRFPPSPQYPKWRGRCFKCCRMGHSVANCRNQRRCGKCWAYGHIGSNCSNPNQTTATKVPPKARREPGFDELLVDPRPYPPPLMPEGRPQQVQCFIERDDEYFIELETLSRAVMVHNLGFRWDLSVEKIANYAVRTGLVQESEVQVSALPGSKFLIQLPSRVDVQTFIRATPADA